MYEVKEIKKGIIKSEDDITKLNFLDWRRTVSGPGRDMRNLTRWLKGNMKYTVLETDLRKAPARDDFPDWHHVGLHVGTGRVYWNWFHRQFWDIQEKELVFSDSPDFWGFLSFPAENGRPPHTSRFWGDIGQVSVHAFADSLFQMSPGDLWITLHGDDRQIILEATADFFATSSALFDQVCNGVPEQEAPSHRQLHLF